MTGEAPVIIMKNAGNQTVTGTISVSKCHIIYDRNTETVNLGALYVLCDKNAFLIFMVSKWL